MQLTNTERGYGWVSIVLHWAVAAGVLAMLWIGLNADWAADAEDRVARRAWMGLHISLGATLIAFALLRVIWYYTQRRPAAPSQSKALNAVAWLTHNALLVAIVIQFISGPLAVFSGGRAISVWGLFSIASPMAESRDLHEFAELMHSVGRYILYIVIPLHVAGALKHAFIDRDGVFTRMLMPPKS